MKNEIRVSTTKNYIEGQIIARIGNRDERFHWHFHLMRDLSIIKSKAYNLYNFHRKLSESCCLSMTTSWHYMTAHT